MIIGGDRGTFTSGHSLYDISNLGMAAHELKSPLALIRQLTLELQGADIADEQRTELLEQIQQTTERALRLTGNLSKSEHLQTNLFPTTSIHPKVMCEDIFTEISPLYAVHSRSLRLRPKATKGLAVANYDLLRRVLLNFADNALHYADEQGVVELYTELLRSKQTVRFGVRDFGPTLPAQVWSDIQRGAWQAGVPARPDSSGLGLMIAHRFAGIIDGKIGAIRHRDGTSFYIDVPISKQLALL